MGSTPLPDERLAHAETLAGSDDASSAPERLERGENVGRYVVLDHLASGGMGAVYRAYDPDLDRAIAVKLLRVGDADEGRTSGARARMMREAQALARLNHPNVLTIYDVGIAADDVFLAMELVDGKTLRAWLEDTHTVAETLAILCDAGRGLAAAHAAGIVHRDIKPENVLVGADGRVRVVDFGLAGGVGEEPFPSLSDSGADTPVPRLATMLTTPLTRRGEMFGTPHYMAPEQYEGRAVDERADQFAFCVTAYEALYGERPFAGTDVVTLSQKVSKGERRALPEGRDVPPAIRDAVLRGLEPDPAARHPSMTALLAVLEPRTPARRGPRWPIAVAAVMVAGLGAGAAMMYLRDKPRVCGDGRAQLVGAWDNDVRARVRAAFEATKASYATASFTKLEAALDHWADRWGAMRVEACRATRERGEQSERLLDLKTVCLDRRRDELAALTAALAGPLDAQAVDRAVEAVSTLPALERCTDAEALLSAAPAPKDAAMVQSIASVRALINEARALDMRGDLELARAKAEAAAARATTIPYPPVQIEALQARAEWEEHTGKYAEAVATLTELVRIATFADDDRALAHAAVWLLWVTGSRQDHYAEADAYARFARPLVEKTGRVDLRAELLNNVGSLELNRGDFAAARETLDRALSLYEETGDVLKIAQLHNLRAQALGNLGDVDGAVADMQRSLELRRTVLGADHPYVAAALNNVALWQKAQGKYDDALANARAALAIMERRVPDHPHFAFTLQTMGLLLAAKGEDAEALVHFERALPILKKTKGDDHPDVADLLNSMGFSLRALGRREEALARHREALAMVEKRLGPDHPVTADTRVSIGLALASLERVDEADAAYRSALASYETSVPPTSPRLAVLLNNIGELANRRHAYKDALDACTRAVAIDEHNLGTEHPDVAYDLLCVGAAQAGLRQIAPAIATHERVVRLFERANGDPDDLATARKELARLRRMAE